MKLRGKDLFELSYRIAGEAAGLLRDYREEGGSIEKINLEKETLKADKASEDYIIDALRKEGFKGEKYLRKELKTTLDKLLSE